MPDGLGVTSFTFMANVKVRRRGASRISAKNQITIPLEALRASGLRAGERVVARTAGPGRILLERDADIVAEFRGALTDAYEADELDRLRDEWH